MKARVDKIRAEWISAYSDLWESKALAAKKLEQQKRLEKRYPALAYNFISVKSRLSHYPRLGEYAEAEKYAEGVIAQALKRNNTSKLMQVAAILYYGEGKKNKRLLAVALRAAHEGLRLQENPRAYDYVLVAECYLASGDHASAKKYACKALKAAENLPKARRDAARKEVEKLKLQG